MNQVVAIIGSLRKESINRQIFEHYAELSSQYFDLVEGPIAEIPLYNEDIKEEPQAVVHLTQKVANSAGIIFFSPEYNYSVPGGLKNALDWLSRSSQKPFDKKKASIIGASPGQIGTARMQYHLRQIGVFLNINFLNKPEVMIGQATTKLENGRIIDPKTVEFLQKHINVFNEFVS